MPSYGTDFFPSHMLLSFKSMVKQGFVLGLSRKKLFLSDQ